MGLLPTTTVDALKSRIDSACKDLDNGIPGVAVSVVGKDGKLMFSHVAGQRGRGSPEPMSIESVFWIASCTKLITGISCMQLVEQGRLSLDDAKQIENICPELKDIKVLQEDGKLVDKKRGITLRMLLSHTGEYCDRRCCI
jgi:CubicO group peptidase (beta-lactamase class C family)